MMSNTNAAYPDKLVRVAIGTRVPYLPEVPTVAESCLPGYEAIT